MIGDGDAGSLPNVLRYEELLAEQPDGVRLPRARRPRGGRPLLHERHDGEPEGRPLLAPLADPPRADGVHRRQPRPALDRPRAAGRADVPRERVGPRARGAADRRRPRDAEPVPAGRAAREADRVRARDRCGRRADDLARPPELRRREQAGPVEPAHGRLRRLGGAAVADAGVRGAPRRAHPPGVGHDGDEPGRVGRPPAEGRGAATRRGRRGRRRAGRCRSSRRGSSTTTATRSSGTARRPASSRCAARGSRARTTTTRPATTSSTTAGCARATLRRSTTQGFIRIADRAKDVIKSGGEWVSSVDLEVALMAHDCVAEAAVIAKPDERWQERPLACVVRKEGTDVSAADLCDAPVGTRREVVDPGRVRLHRRGAEDERRQVRQEGAAQAARGRRARGPRARSRRRRRPSAA